MEISSPELLKNWKIFVNQKKITQPTVKDLFDYLSTAGLSKDLIEKALEAQIDFSKYQKSQPAQDNTNKRFSEQQKESYFNQITVMLKKLNDAQIQELIKEINYG